MCMSGGAKAPEVPPVPPAPAPAKSAEAEMQSARTSQAEKAAAAGGMQSTIATSALGDTSTAAVQKQKLGA